LGPETEDDRRLRERLEKFRQRVAERCERGDAVDDRQYCLATIGICTHKSERI